LSDLNPELEQFTMDTRRAPKRIFGAHLPDQRAQLRLDLRSPSQWARSLPPIAARAACAANNQLMSKHRVLSFKPQLRLEWRGQDGQSEKSSPIIPPA
jgi:hypothetical protein